MQTLSTMALHLLDLFPILRKFTWKTLSVAPIFKLSDYSTRLNTWKPMWQEVYTPLNLQTEYWVTFQTWMLTRKVVMWFMYFRSAWRKACENDTDDAQDCSPGQGSKHFQERQVEGEATNLWIIWCWLPIRVSTSFTTGLSCHGVIQFKHHKTFQLLIRASASHFHSYLCLAPRKEATTATSTKHCQDRETPIPIYIEMMIHTKTHNR